MHSPGPATVGRCKAFESMGVQTSSERRSQPRFAVQRAERFPVSKGADKSNWPGPASYNF
jgi:hypothetical protein